MTKASFDTVIGLLFAGFFGSSAKVAAQHGQWICFVIYFAATLLFIRVFLKGYSRLPEK